MQDLKRSLHFYRDGLDWPVSSASNPDIAFLRTRRAGIILWSRQSLAEDAGGSPEGSGFGGIALAHNVATKEDVDAVLAEAQRAGGSATKAAVTTDWGGYSGYFAGPDGFPWEVAWNPFFPLGPDGSVLLPD